MSPKLFLVLVTAVAVVADSLLHPFYPQYFAAVFEVRDPAHVALYIAACSLTVLLAFPAWAQVARRIHPLRLLIATQVATGALALACYATSSLAAFWVASLAMMVFKASYLLVYPYVMTLTPKSEHVSAIGLLAFVVYFGNILAALVAGVVFELVDPRSLFLVMAAGDVVQLALCAALLAAAARGRVAPVPLDPADEAAPRAPRGFVLRLGAVMLAMYWSAYLTEPFFSAYWEGVSGIDHRVVTGLVFAIPGAAALAGLWVNARRGDAGAAYGGVLPAVGLAIGGLWLCASGVPGLVLAGRFAYGWALFQAMVRLDALLFRYSTPARYAVDFSKANLFQGLGVLGASLADGAIVSALGARATFVLAAGGFVVAIALYGALFRRELWPRGAAAEAAGAAGEVPA